MIRNVSGLRPRILIAIALIVAACTHELSSPPAADVDLRSAKGSGGTAAVKVSSALPDSGIQNTTIDVVVNGSGFEDGMVATWKLAGVADPLQVRTNSTRYVSSRKLVANITITADASVADWDIEVMGKGKGGIGTEIFTVKAVGNIDRETKHNLVFDEMVNVAVAGESPIWAPALITGDYRGRNGASASVAGSGEYQGEFCGVITLVNKADGSINVELDRGYDASTMQNSCGNSRYYRFYFSGRANAPLHYGPQHYVWELDSFDVGESRLQGVMFGIQQKGCNGLHFNALYAPANSARVTRLVDSLTVSGSVRRWRVESQGNHRAMCTTFSNKGPVPTGNHYYMPFAFTVTEVPYPFPRFP